jgi:aldehyde:ferredoxin oxidoreductase
LCDQPISEGPPHGKNTQKTKVEELKDIFYELREGGKKTGIPKRETLEGLSLKYIADDLQKMGAYGEVR